MVSSCNNNIVVGDAFCLKFNVAFFFGLVAVPVLYEMMGKPCSAKEKDTHIHTRVYLSKNIFSVKSCREREREREEEEEIHSLGNT